MTFDDPMIQRAFYTLGLPGGLGVLLALVAVASKRERLATWAVPIAALVGVGLCFVQPFHDAPEPGSFGGEFAASRWKWLLPTLAALLIAWPALLMLPRRRWAGPAIIVGVAVVGLLLGPARYDDTKGQPLGYVFVAPAALLVLAVPLAWSARRRDGAGDDLAAVSIAGLAAVPIIGLTEFHSPAMLAGCVATAAAGATLIALLLRGERFADARSGLAAGAMVVPLALVPAAMTAWLVQAELGKLSALALATPIVAATAAIVLPRLPRPTFGPLLAAIVCGVGLALTLLIADTSPYVTLPPWAETALGDWSTPPQREPAPTATIDEAAEADFWGGN